MFQRILAYSVLNFVFYDVELKREEDLLKDFFESQKLLSSLVHTSDIMLCRPCEPYLTLITCLLLCRPKISYCRIWQLHRYSQRPWVRLQFEWASFGTVDEDLSPGGFSTQLFSLVVVFKWLLTNSFDSLRISVSLQAFWRIPEEDIDRWVKISYSDGISRLQVEI